MKMIHEKLPGLSRGAFLLPAGSGAGSRCNIVENRKLVGQGRQPSAHSTTPYTTLASVP